MKGISELIGKNDWISVDSEQMRDLYPGVWVRFLATDSALALTDGIDSSVSILLNPFRQGVAAEVYCFCGEARGKHIAYFPIESLEKPGGTLIKKEWLIDCWDSYFEKTLGPINSVRFSFPD